MDQVQVRKEVNENIRICKPTRETILLCANGFQTQDTHDSTPMMEYFNNNFREQYQNCHIVCVKLFEPGVKKTHHAKLFEKTLSDAIVSYGKAGYDIILLGYSFSSALAAKMSYKYQNYISRLILVAPVHDTLVNGAIPGYIEYAVKFSKLQKKYGKRVANAVGRQTVVGLPGLLIAIFYSILKNRKYFKKVQQDTLLIRGDADVLCTPHSIAKVNKKIQGEHVLYAYPKMSHGILKTLKLNGVVYEDILNFCFDTPYILEKNVTLTAQEKRQEVKNTALDDDGEEIPTFNEIFAKIDPDCDEVTLEEDM